MRTCLCAILAAVGLLPGRTACAQGYTLTDLSAGQASSSFALGINDSGQVCGGWAAPGFAGAVLWSTNGGVVTPTDIYSGGVALFVNAGGQVAGTDANIFGASTFLYSAGTTFLLPPISPGYSNRVTGMNASGMVVGFSSQFNSIFGFVWDGTSVHWFPGDIPWSINDLGHIVLGSGQVVLADGTTLFTLPTFNGMSVGLGQSFVNHAINNLDALAGIAGSLGWFYSQATGYIAIDGSPFPGDGGTEIEGINDAGQAFGESFGSFDHPFIWSHAGGLNALSMPADVITADIYAFNNNGECAGWMYSNLTADAAWVYRPGSGMQDLNCLVPHSSGLRILEAHGINNLGQIAAKARDVQNALHSVLLTPSGPVSNSPPVADGASYTTNHDTAIDITLTAIDPYSEPVGYTIVSQPANGTLSGTPPFVTYTPNAGVSGSDGFTFQATNGCDSSNVATISITVNPTNSAPVAAPQSVSLNEDTSLPISLAATDANGDPLTYSIVTVPIHGTLSGAAPNVIYTPFANYNGADSFIFKANDGIADSNIAAVSITVNPVNDPPIARNGAVTTREDTAVNILLTASDVDGDPLTYILVSAPAHGTLSGSGSNRTYTPSPDYNGPDSFTYKVNDGTVDSNVATVSITVNAVNDPPVAVNDAAVTSRGNSVVVDVLANDTDVDGDTLAVTTVSKPARGKAVINPDGTVTYTPTGTYTGPDSFTYTISDGHGGSATATVSVSVITGNAPPRAVTDRAVTGPATPVTINVLANDSDPDGDALSVVGITQGATGTVVLNGDGTVTYTPAPAFFGRDTFTYSISDGNGGIAVGTVRVRVTK
jgi:hypothetical protein